MPQIQYSEKYYDDVYEYRRAAGASQTTLAWQATAACALIDGHLGASVPAAGRVPRVVRFRQAATQAG